MTGETEMTGRPGVVIVTGAARGIGRAIAIGLADSGMQVVALCRPRGASPRSSELSPGGDVPSADDLPTGDNLLRVDGDVRSAEDCERAVAAAFDRFSGLDAVVNNAALAHDRFPGFHSSEFADVDDGLWRQLFDVNVNGVYQMTKAVVPALRRRGWGRIVNLSTSMASMLSPGVLPYGPSKAAVMAMTAGWAAHFRGTGITVNELLPGGPTGPRVASKHWWPDDQPVWPAEIMVPPLRWLLSPESDGVTGHRFIARLWDATLPAARAAAGAGHPTGWTVPEVEIAQRPKA